jgi:hypothetical protein
MGTLKILIKKIYFDQITSEEKKIEYRDVKSFWQSRLYDANGKKRIYDNIEFINVYMLMLSE